jgi:hypothetical protein
MPPALSLHLKQCSTSVPLTCLLTLLHLHPHQDIYAASVNNTWSATIEAKQQQQGANATHRGSNSALVALDMMARCWSCILAWPPPAAVRAVQAALSAGVRVVLATGKARPAALSAWREAGLASGRLEGGGS